MQGKHLLTRGARHAGKHRAKPSRCLSLIHVAVSPGERRRGTVIAGAIRVPCALGRGGAQIKWREGDGRTPLGLFSLRTIHYRADRVPVPGGRLPKRAVGAGDWWCDVVSDRRYNRLVRDRPPPPASEERLRRRDNLYDIIVEIGFNDRPVVRGKGSGIFWHVARPAFSPTAGCIATSLAALQRILPFIGPHTRIRIG